MRGGEGNDVQHGDDEDEENNQNKDWCMNVWSGKKLMKLKSKYTNYEQKSIHTARAILDDSKLSQ